MQCRLHELSESLQGPVRMRGGSGVPGTDHTRCSGAALSGCSGGIQGGKGGLIPVLLPFCGSASPACVGNTGAGKVLAKAPEGGTGWRRPGRTLPIPKPGPVEREMGGSGGLQADELTLPPQSPHMENGVIFPTVAGP